MEEKDIFDQPDFEFLDNDIQTELKKDSYLNEHDQMLSAFFNKYLNKDITLHQAMAIDLYRAINCYRYYHDVEALIEANPEAEAHRSEVVSLWEEFDRLSAKELSEIAIKALQEV